MSLVIHQIGNVPLNLWASSMAGLEIEIARVWRGTVERMGKAPVTTLDMSHSVLDPVEVSISGTLLYSHGRPIHEQLNQLMALGGQPYVDVIAYLPNECCTMGSKCNVCGGKAQRCVQWIHTVAFLQEVTPSNGVNEGEMLPIDGVTVDILLVLRDLWQPLNPWIWEADYGGGVVTGLRQVDDICISPLPCKPPIRKFDQAPMLVFNKKIYRYPFEMYHVDVWSRTPDARGHGWGQWETYTVGESAARWSAPPTAEYMFKRLTTTGTIDITVESEMGGYFRNEHLSSLDLSGLNEQLVALGYGDLQEDDILIATDSLYGPSVLVRDGVILQDIFPVWRYDYEHIGQMLGPINRVHISGPLEMHSAHLHVYRSY